MSGSPKYKGVPVDDMTPDQVNAALIEMLENMTPEQLDLAIAEMGRIIADRSQAE